MLRYMIGICLVHVPSTYTCAETLMYKGCPFFGCHFIGIRGNADSWQIQTIGIEASVNGWVACSWNGGMERASIFQQTDLLVVEETKHGFPYLIYQLSCPWAMLDIVVIGLPLNVMQIAKLNTTSISASGT